MNNDINVLNTFIEHILPFYLVIYCFLSLFFKPDKSRIYCGVFAFCGPTNLTKGAYSTILSNIKLLGLLNDSRGGDNAGVLINNQVYHTTGYRSKFSELLQDTVLESPNPHESTVVIGHCRKGSVGGKAHKHAHPFEIFNDEHETDFCLSGVHNGTVSNWEELAENYSINPKEVDNDSKVMLTILSRQRNLKRKQPVFRVLTQYEGYGVFMWYFVDEPNTLYVFKGASLKYETDKTLTEERPLYSYECPNTKGIYFSSLNEPLKMIAEDPTKIVDVECNIIYKIVEGKVKERIDIDRDNVKPWFPTYSTNSKIKVKGFQGHGGTGGRQAAMYEEMEEFSHLNYELTDNFVPKKEIVLPVRPAETKTISLTEKIFNDKNEATTKLIVNAPVSLKRDRPSQYATSKYDRPKQSLSQLGNTNIIYRMDGLYYSKSKLLDGAFTINKQTYKCYASDDSEVQKELKENPLLYETKYFFEGYLLGNYNNYVSLSNVRAFAIQGNKPSWKTADKADNFLSFYCNMPVPGIYSKDTVDGTIYYISGTKANFRVEGPSFTNGKVYNYVEGKLLSVLTPIVNNEAVIDDKVQDEETKNAIIVPSPENLEKMALELGIPLTKVRPDFNLEDDSREINPKTEEVKLTVEDKYLIDSNEEKILDLYNELFDKSKEQLELIAPYHKAGILNDQDFLSGIFSCWFADSMINSLITPGGKENSSPYYKLESSELIYKGIDNKEDITNPIF